MGKRWPAGQGHEYAWWYTSGTAGRMARTGRSRRPTALGGVNNLAKLDFETARAVWRGRSTETTHHRDDRSAAESRSPTARQFCGEFAAAATAAIRAKVAVHSPTACPVSYTHLTLPTICSV